MKDIVLQGQRPELCHIPAGVPDFLKDVMTRSWAQNPQERPLFSGLKIFVVFSNAQYKPPTRCNCGVDSHRRCIRNSQLVGNSFCESEHICQQRVELRHVSGVNAPVGSRRE